MRRVVTAPVEQVLTGMPVADGEAAVCADCGERVRDGARVGVVACRCVDCPTWSVRRVHCLACRPDTAKVRTLGVEEVLVVGRLGVVTDGATQQSRAVVLAPECVNYCGPAIGSG